MTSDSVPDFEPGDAAGGARTAAPAADDAGLPPTVRAARARRQRSPGARTAPRVVGLDELATPAGVPIEGLVPPPRFEEATLASYDPQHPTQAEAEARVADFVDAALASQRPSQGWRRWVPFADGSAAPEGRGLYLDGGFGVGKTHLLAAAWHAAAERHAEADLLYLSFQELVHLIGVLGRPAATERLAGKRLICIDEFELDDPGNTLIVKTFLAAVFERGGAVVTTSNTPPEAQGRGRFNASDFAREIQSIAKRFEIQEVGGPDYRHRDQVGRLLDEDELDDALRTEAQHDPRGLVVATTWPELRTFLGAHHPSRIRGTLEPVAALYVRGIEAIPDQNDALRFVHFVDRVYDLRIRFRASGTVELEDLYHPSYREGAYAKKHHRSLSRLTEMLQEGPAAG